MARLLLIRHSGRRQVEEAEVLEALEASLRSGPRNTVHVDTQQFADDVGSGQWSGHDAYLRGRVEEIQRLANASEDVRMHYAGLAEIPHVIAFGAALGDERAVTVHEYDRDQSSWARAGDDAVDEVVITGAVGAPIVSAAGCSVLRVAISAIIQDSDVRAVVPEDETIADVTVTFAEGELSTNRVRSESQLLLIRQRIRDGIAAIKNFRPNTHTLHLFVAAPNSVCFVLGQELVPRNSPPAQTYICRRNEGAESFQPAIRITASAQGSQFAALSEDDVALAAKLRAGPWATALGQVRNFSETKLTERRRTGEETGPWYVSLEPATELTRVAPFPTLPPIYTLVSANDRIDPEPYYEPYGHDPERRLWRLSDDLVLEMYRAADADERKMLPLLRLFFFHEYVHAYHSLTKFTAINVGKFANALERLDYTADTFAIFHEWDYQRYVAVGSGDSAPTTRQALADQVDQILRSFWAFDGTGPHDTMQVRRVRRYLNWYWRLTQLRRATSDLDAVALFARSPAVELAGAALMTDGDRRVFYQFDRPRRQRLEVALVLEDERLLRIVDSDSVSLQALLDSFYRGDHSAIVSWFRPVFEVAERFGAVYPTLHPFLSREN